MRRTSKNLYEAFSLLRIHMESSSFHKIMKTEPCLAAQPHDGQVYCKLHSKELGVCSLRCEHDVLHLMSSCLASGSCLCALPGRVEQEALCSTGNW